MAAAASMNHVMCKRIELQGYAVVLLLCLSCLLVGVDAKEVNLSMDESAFSLELDDSA